MPTETQALITIKDVIGRKKLFIFDTCILINTYKELERGDGPTKKYLDTIPRENRSTTIVNLFEFLFVQEISRDDMKKREKWLDGYGIKVLPFSKNSSKTFNSLSRARRPHSSLLGDMLIASITIAEGCALATRNISDFRGIRELFLVSEFASI